MRHDEEGDGEEMRYGIGVGDGKGGYMHNPDNRDLGAYKELMGFTLVIYILYHT